MLTWSSQNFVFIAYANQKLFRGSACANQKLFGELPPPVFKGQTVAKYVTGQSTSKFARDLDFKRGC